MKFKKIAVGIDFSSYSEVARLRALQLAKTAERVVRKSPCSVLAAQEQ
jgi:nucleotide-binding universal stress UspA family protein